MAVKQLIPTSISDGQGVTQNGKGIMRTLGRSKFFRHGMLFTTAVFTFAGCKNEGWHEAMEKSIKFQYSAKSLNDQAELLERQGKYVEAMEKFKQAYVQAESCLVWTSAASDRGKNIGERFANGGLIDDMGVELTRARNGVEVGRARGADTVRVAVEQ